MELATVGIGSRPAPHRPPSRRRPTPVLVTRALVVLHVLAVTWLVAGGSLYIDDLRAQAYAAGRTWWPFVVESNRTHLAPGARTVDWFMARLAPLEHWPAVVLTALIALLLAVATVRLVPRVIAHPWARVLAVAWVLFAASVVPTYAWFRQALTVMLPLALVLLAVGLVVDHARTRRWQLLVGALALHVLALTFSERALAVPVVALAVLVATTPGGWRVRGWWRRAVVTLAPFAVVNVLFLLAYASGDFDTAQGARPGVLDAVVKVGRWVLVDLLPSFLGGPVVWRAGNGAYSFAATPTVLVVAAAVLFVAGLVVARRTPGSLRAAAPVALASAAYAVPVLAMVYVGRLAQVDDVTAADDLRLLPDVSAAVALALAALVGAVLERRGPAGGGAPRTARWAVLAVLSVAAVLCAISWVSFGVRWHDTPVSGYLATLRAAVAATTAPVLPTPVPADVVPGWVDPGFTTRPLVELVNPDAVGSLLPSDPVVVDESGELVPAALGLVVAAAPPAGFCGYAIPAGEQSVTIPLRATAPYYRGSIVQLGVLVGDSTRLNVSVTGRDGTTSPPLVTDPPELLRGPHRVYAQVPYGTAVTDVTVIVENENTAGVCVTSVQVSTVGANR